MENIEQVTGKKEVPPIKFTNLIQAELIKLSHDEPMIWVEKNSANFRKLLEANPNLLRDYESNSTDENKKKKFLEFVAGALEDIRDEKGLASN